MTKDAQEKPNFKSGILNFFAFFCQNYTHSEIWPVKMTIL